MLPQRPGDDPYRYHTSPFLSAGNRLPPLNTNSGPGNSPRDYQSRPSSAGMGTAGQEAMGYWDRERERDGERQRNQGPPGSSSIGGGREWRNPSLPSISRPNSSRLPPMIDSSWDNAAYHRHPGSRPTTSPHHIPTPVTSLPSINDNHFSPRFSYRSPASPGDTSYMSQASPSGQPSRVRRDSDAPEQGEKHPGSPGSTQGRRGSLDGEGGQKKKKRRVALSCAECAKRKQKCNRETPCQHCVSRRVPELCVPYTREGSPPPRNRNRGGQKGEGVKVEVESSRFNAAAPGSLNKDATGAVSGPTPGPKPASQLPTLTVRVSRVEALLNAMVNRVPGVGGKALDDWRINHAPATSPPPISSQRAVHSGTRSRASSSASLSKRDTAEGKEESTEADDVLKIDRETLTRNPIPQEMMSSNTQPVNRSLDYHGGPAQEFERLLRGSSIKMSYVHDLISDLPDRARADILINRFFEKFNFVRYPIDEEPFRKGYEWIYGHLETVNPRSLQFLPLVCVVFSIGYMLEPQGLDIDEEARRAESTKFYRNTRLAIFVSRAIIPESIQVIETRILLGLFLILIHGRRLSEGWAELRNAITSAQVVGLHRDGAMLGFDAYNTEYRRRLWSFLLHADATYSCLLGRPTCIDADSRDAKQPSNVELPGLHQVKPRDTPSKPIGETTFATYLILRCQLGEIVARIAKLFSRLTRPIQYEEVKEIEHSFQSFMGGLPPDFRMRNPNKSNDQKLWYLPIHRYYIQTEVLHFRIILHRPYLLRKLRSTRYQLSRNACFDSAILDFKIRNAFKRDVPDFFETLLGGSFREFNAAMIAGISVILDPLSAHAEEMRAIVRTFMDHFPHDESKSRDHFSIKEAGIIHTLHRRAKEAEEKRASRPRAGDTRFGFGPLRQVSAERDEPGPNVHPTSSARDSLALATGQMTSTSEQQGPAHTSPGYNTGTHRSSDGGSSTGYPVTQPMDMSHNRWQSISSNPPGGGGGSTSDEDPIDQPQQLLNHWLFHNQMNPQMPYVPNGAEVGQMFVDPTNAGFGNLAPSANQAGSVMASGGGMITGWSDPFQSGDTDGQSFPDAVGSGAGAGVIGGGSGSGSGPLPGQNHGMGSLTMSGDTAGSGGFGAGTGAGTMGSSGLDVVIGPGGGDHGVWGDGNNVQFWNKMIDGIQTAQNGSGYQLSTGA